MERPWILVGRFELASRPFHMRGTVPPPPPAAADSRKVLHTNLRLV